MRIAPLLSVLAQFVFATATTFVDVGVNVVRGTARLRSKDPAYLGNGDTIEFSKAAFDAEMAARRPAA